MLCMCGCLLQNPESWKRKGKRRSSEWEKELSRRSFRKRGMQLMHLSSPSSFFFIIFPFSHTHESQSGKTVCLLVRSRAQKGSNHTHIWTHQVERLKDRSCCPLQMDSCIHNNSSSNSRTLFPLISLSSFCRCLLFLLTSFSCSASFFWKQSVF